MKNRHSIIISQAVFAGNSIGAFQFQRVAARFQNQNLTAVFGQTRRQRPAAGSGTDNDVIVIDLSVNKLISLITYE